MKSGEMAARAILERDPGAYKKLWESRFRRRFLLMRTIKQHLSDNSENIEKWVALHKRPEVQELAIELWLNKKPEGDRILMNYLKIFRHFLKL